LLGYANEPESTVFELHRDPFLGNRLKNHAFDEIVAPNFCYAARVLLRALESRGKPGFRQLRT